MSRGFRWAIFILLALLVMLVVAPQPITIAFHLIVGWTSYLSRVLPKVRVNGGGVATAIACLAATTALGHWFARWLWGSTAPAAPWRMRWTLAIIAIVVLMFVAGIGATGVAHQTTWLARSEQPVFVPRPRRERANRVKCASNLKQIHLALTLYARDHSGRLPDSLGEILIHADVTPEVLICPSSNDEKPPGATPQEQAAHLQHGRHCSYVYHGRGLSLPLATDLPIACEPAINHNDGMNVLFGDGHVEFLSGTSAERAMSKLR